jgi:very-short-patch-repair endonuclease
MLSQFDATYYGYHQQPAQKVKDAIRQKVLEKTGLNCLRFEDKEVRKDVK